MNSTIMNQSSLLLTGLCLLLLAACKPDESTATAVTNNETTEVTTMPEQTGSYVEAVLPDRNNPKTQLLLRTFWVAEHWVNHADNSQNLPNKGRWWRFKEDGTFTFGQWQQQLTYGSWVVHFDGDKELIHMDAANDEYDMEFHMQAVSQLKDYMAWAGTGTYDQKRIAVKATSLLTMPTKAQFGIAE